MSTLVTKNVQVGTSATTSQNFLLYQPSTPDGTARIAYGASGSQTDVLTVTNSGNIGLGVTPSAWSTSYKAFDIGTFGGLASSVGGTTILSANYYGPSGSLAYKGNGYAGGYNIRTDNGEHRWFIGPNNTSGAGAALTLTQAMTLDANGRLVIGNTSASSTIDVFGLQTNSSSTSASAPSGTMRLAFNGGAASGNYGASLVFSQQWVTGGGQVATGQISGIKIAGDGNYGGGLAFWTSNGTGNDLAERVRIDSSGNVGIGTSSPQALLDVKNGTTYSSSGTWLARVQQNTNIAGNNGLSVMNAWAADTSKIFECAMGWNGVAAGYYPVFTVDGLGQVIISPQRTEAVRINSNGNLLVGTTSQVGTSRISAYKNSTGYMLGLNAGQASSGNTYYQVEFYSAGNFSGSITSTTSAVAYNTSSDYRLKHDINPIRNALERVAALKPVTYKWNTDNSDGEGFIAHELQEVVPQAVTGEKDAVDKDGNPIYQGIDTSHLVATLTAAIQELKAELDTVKAELQSLKG